MENAPSTFDDSLIPVDIKVMHDGLNLNNSTIFMDAIEDAKETLKNKPILGYIKKVDGDDTKDFSGHEIEVNLTENGIKIVALQRPLGVIPENNNYSITQENGKNYVMCRGYLWKDYMNDAYEVLKNNPKKSVSMEIAVDDYDINEDGSINITKYRYLGISILGDDLLPGMENAELNVVGHFTKKDNKDFYNKIEELNKMLSEHFTIQQLDNTIEGGENMALEDKKDFVEEEAKNEDAQPENFVRIYELSHDDIRTKLYRLLAPIEEADEDDYWISEVYDDYFIYGSANKYYKQHYIKTDVDVALDGKRVEVFVEYVTAEELAELNTMRETYPLLVEENKELRTYKEQKEKEEFEAEQARVRKKKIDYINTEYEKVPEEVKDMFISKVDDYETIEDLDADICVYIVKNKVVFSKTTKNEPSSVKLGLEKENNTLNVSPYGNLFSL